MIPEVIEAQYTQEFTIHLRFSDGTEGDVDLSQELYGELFEPLKDACNICSMLAIFLFFRRKKKKED